MMIEVHPCVYVGNAQDYEERVSQGGQRWSVVQACKFPFHRDALGYTGNAAPKGHPEYLVARRENRLILNMVDSPNPAFFSYEMITAALDFCEVEHLRGQFLFIHCNQGESRAPSLALLLLATRLQVIPNVSLFAAEEAFLHLYPYYHPGDGLYRHMQQHWSEYCAIVGSTFTMEGDICTEPLSGGGGER